MLSADASLYSQQVAGCDNGVANALSCFFELDALSLTSYIHHKFSVSLQLIPLPQEISLWMTLLLRRSRSVQSWSLPEQTGRQPQLGADEPPILDPSASLTMISSNPSPLINDCRLSSPL